MTDIAIRVENLSKLYTIGRAQQRHDTLRDALVNALPRISRKGQANSSNSSHSWQKEGSNSSDSRNSWQESTYLWALRDVSFEACPECNRRVQRGEVVGVPSTELRAGSSGMVVRLAFAVAAHPSTGSGRRLEPETCPEQRRSILLVDESLP